MRTRRRYLRRRFRNRYVVFARCAHCQHEEEVAVFQRVADAREWVRRKQPRSIRRLTIVREV